MKKHFKYALFFLFLVFVTGFFIFLNRNNVSSEEIVSISNLEQKDLNSYATTTEMVNQNSIVEDVETKKNTNTTVESKKIVSEPKQEKEIIKSEIIQASSTIETLSPPNTSSSTSSSLMNSLELELQNELVVQTIIGKAIWYGAQFQGNKMANGEIFDMNDPTIVAHRTLKFGTKLKITNTKNGNIIYAIVSDRGPFSYKWITDESGELIKKYTAEIDVSYAGAKLLGIDRAGIGNVKIEVY